MIETLAGFDMTWCLRRQMDKRISESLAYEKQPIGV